MNTILLRKVLRDLRASLGQTAALIVLVALGIAGLIGLIGSYRDLSSSYERTYKELDFADVSFSVAAMPQSQLKKITAVDGVRSVSGRLIFNTGMERPRQEAGTVAGKVRARLIGVPDDRRPKVNNLYIIKGGYLRPGDKKIVLESHFADFYRLKPGDVVKPIVNGRKKKFKIIGTATGPEYLLVSAGRQDIIPTPETFGVIFMSLPELQRLTGAGETINNINVLFNSEVDKNEIVKKIKKRLRPYGLIETVLRKDQPSNKALRLDVEGFKELAYILPVLILLAALASIYMLLSRVVLVQRSQIGTAKALGYPNGPIVGQYMLSALVVGLLGSILGWLGGVPLAAFITSSYAGELGIPLVKTNLHPDLMIIGAVLSLIVSALAGLGPAWGAAKTAPAAAMHPDISTKQTAMRLPEWIKSVGLPLWILLPMRSVFRVKRRTISTCLGVVFSLALFIIGWGMINSLDYMIIRNFDLVEQWDQLVAFNSPVVSKAVLKKMEKTKGVESVTPLVQLPGKVKAHDKSSDIWVIGLPLSQKAHVVQLSGNRSLRQAAAGGGVILNTAVAKKLDVDLGDRVKVKTPFGTHRLKVGGISSELMSAVSYVSINQVKKWAEIDGVLFNAAYIKTSCREDKVQADLYRLPGVSSVQSKSSQKRAWETLAQLYFSLLGFIFMFAAAMAFALMFNAVTVSTLERLREYATMRAMGTGIGRLSFFMVFEDLILWSAALVPGVILGWWATNQIAKTFESDIFYFQVVIFNSTYVYSALSVLAAMFLATLPAVRRVARLNLAETTRVMS